MIVSILARTTASGLALATALAAVSANAACTPNPPQTLGTTTCTGTSGAITSRADQTSIAVTAGSQVLAAPTDQAAITLTPVPAQYQTYDRVTVDGSVIGGPVPGILVKNDGGSTAMQANIVVSAGGTITGSSAILLSANSGTSFYASAAIDNSGTISGLAGAALVATDANKNGFSSVLNNVSGLIGGIDGNVGTLTNLGLIDGGSGSAYRDYVASVAGVPAGQITNNGTMRSSGSAATLLLPSSVAITNSGVIENDGSGPAISGAIVNLTNQAGATVSTGGTTAIASTGYLNLTNRGTITGSISVTTDTASTFGSVIGSLVDSTGGGSIVGNVSMGYADDVLVADYLNGGLVTGISGTIDPGAGTNLLRVKVSTSTTIGSLALPTGFQKLQFALADNATATLAPGFTSAGTISFGGSGTLVNNANLSGTGPILSHYFTDPGNLVGGVNLTNNGTISSVLSGNDYAVRWFSALAFNNSGTITSTGGTGAVTVSVSGSFTNSGTISGDGYGVNTFDTPVTNSGTIRSNNGIALYSNGSASSSISLNSGIIDGQQAGVSLNTNLANTGLIRSNTTGVQFNFYGALYNRSGGVITAPTAIGYRPDIGYTAQSVVTNAGTINGNVDFGRLSYAPYGSSNTFVALPGGILNGNLNLGSGYDTFITSFDNDGPGQYAGVTGTVSGAGVETIRYRVLTDTNGAIAQPGIFGVIGYDVVDNAKLTLTASAPLAVPMVLSGMGSIDFNADLTVTGQPLIQVYAPLFIPGSGQTSLLSDLAITSRGALKVSQGSGYVVNGITLTANDSFTNMGTLSISANANPNPDLYNIPSGVFGGSAITNNGSILVANAVAINGGASVINSGTIGQIDGSAAGRGIINTSQITNSGTISTIGNAIELSYNSSVAAKVDNQGTIASSSGVAITAPFSFQKATLTNRAGGTISGGSGKAAILLGGGWTVFNSGTINGNVDLSAQNYIGLASTYDGAAGTLSGNLTFGSGNDILIVQDGVTGVTGQIDGGAGTDTVIRRRTTSGSITLGGSLPSNFENEGVEALGADTTVTVTGPAGGLSMPLNYYGDGTIISRVDTIAGGPNSNALTLGGRIDGAPGLLAFTNEGTLGNGLLGTARSLTNNGTISGGYGVALSSIDAQTASQTVSVTNSGTISVTGANSANALQVAVNRYTYGAAAPSVPQSSITVVNSGTIASSGAVDSYFYYQAVPHDAISLLGDDTTVFSITNGATGVISTDGPGGRAIAVNASAGATLTIDNAGQISGGKDRRSVFGSLPAAISVIDATTTIRNSGTITGAILLGSTDDVIENRGTITGNVYMGAGNDTFLQLAGTVTGTVDGGDGLDTVAIDTAHSTNVNAGQFINFERFTQAGSGNATYNGNFSAQSFSMTGGSLTVAQGSSLTSSDPVTITGSDAGEQVTNLGTISGSVSLGAGNDAVLNRGTIGGAVLLGDGDDSFTEGVGSRIAGPVDGGSGTNTYIVDLTSDRTGIGARTNFQTLAVTGNGTLTLTLDQSWQRTMLAGNNLNLSLAGFSAGAITGSDAAEQVNADADLTSVSLGGGNDLLSLRTTTLAGTYDGGTGSNLLRTTGSGPVTLSGSVANFGQLEIPGGALTIAGSLTNAQGPTVLSGSGLNVAIERGATVSGGLTLGGGGNALRVVAGSTISGAIIGGDGSAPSTLQFVNDGGTMSAGGTYSGFATTTVTGGGTIQINGALATGALAFDGNFTIAPNASLTAPTVSGSVGDNVFTIRGGFTGALDLGAGNDTLRLTGSPTLTGSFAGGAGSNAIELAVAGTDAAPTNIGTTTFTGFQTLRTTSGVAIMGGTRSFDSIQVGAGSRLIGAAGSVFTAPQINVAAGGTFGTAGTVNGNIAVAGTLSPGASPGTMTVNGNVALAAGSTSLFELTTGVSDQLLVSGNVTIASGATLTLTGTRPLTPGVTLDLIVANGGISGSFSTVNQPSSIGGFLSQSATRLSLLGTFLTSGSFSPQVNRAIDGVNALLISGRASSAVIAAVPQLLAGGAADPAAFARISPEPFATAMELGTEDGLSLIDATRTQSRSGTTATGLYSFGQGLGYRYRARGDAGQGVDGSHLSSTGGFAGLGYGAGIASIGAFVGYGHSHQRVDALGSKIDGDGAMFGLQGELSFAGLKATGLIAYDERSVGLDRATVGGKAMSDFHLRSVIGDVTVRYSMPLLPGWTIQPRVGASYVRTSHGAISENGPSPFTLDLASAHGHRWFVDGGIDLAAGLGPVHAFAGLGLRHRLTNDDTSVTATFANTTAPITALGIKPEKDAVLGTVGAAIDLTPSIALSAGYTGAFAHTTRHSGTIGLRWRM